MHTHTHTLASAHKTHTQTHTFSLLLGSEFSTDIVCRATRNGILHKLCCLPDPLGADAANLWPHTTASGPHLTLLLCGIICRCQCSVSYMRLRGGIHMAPSWQRGAFVAALPLRLRGGLILLLLCTKRRRGCLAPSWLSSHGAFVAAADMFDMRADKHIHMRIRQYFGSNHMGTESATLQSI